MTKIVVTRDIVAETVAKTFGVTIEKVLLASSVKEFAYQSLDVVELVCALEDRFHIKIDFEDGNQLMNLDDAVLYLQKKIEEAAEI